MDDVMSMMFIFLGLAVGSSLHGHVGGIPSHCCHSGCQLAKGQSMDALEHILRLAYTCILTMSTAMSFALTVSTPPRP